jgi:hypothetical protein
LKNLTWMPAVRPTVESPWCERQEDSGDTGRTATGAQGRAARPYRGAATDTAHTQAGVVIPRKAVTARSEDGAPAPTVSGNQKALWGSFWRLTRYAHKQIDSFLPVSATSVT